MVKSRENLISAWAFLIGVVLAILIGIFQRVLGGPSRLIISIVYTVLVLLGLLVGFLVEGDKDSTTFLIAALALVIVSGLGKDSLIYISNLSPITSYLSEVLSALLIMFVPATIIAALKTVFSITSI